MKIPFVSGPKQRLLMAYQAGEVDLCIVRGKWFLHCVCDIPETERFEPEDWLGIDLGIVNISADSDGTIYSGAEVEARRIHLARRRAGLQKRGTKAAKRRLKKLSGKQRRYQHHINHCISKQIVASAERTERGIALEDLKGIRTRVTATSRQQRSKVANWAFHQLRTFIEYKATLAGVPVALVRPTGTSITCSCCGHTEKANRLTREVFECVSCGHTEPADLNAARNIRARAALATPLSSQVASAA